jgi:hypothetical protein
LQYGKLLLLLFIILVLIFFLYGWLHNFDWFYIVCNKLIFIFIRLFVLISLYSYITLFSKQREVRFFKDASDLNWSLGYKLYLWNFSFSWFHLNLTHWINFPSISMLPLRPNTSLLNNCFTILIRIFVLTKWCIWGWSIFGCRKVLLTVKIRISRLTWIPNVLLRWNLILAKRSLVQRGIV